jgi:hypothetical protein
MEDQHRQDQLPIAVILLAEEPYAIEHAYAVTSHRSLGLSRERVYLAIDTSRSEELVNRRQFCVGVSRAIEDARVYRDERLALVRAVSRDQGRETALELLRKDDERHEHGDDSALGRDRRGEGADRGREPSRLGAEGPRGEARASSDPERDRLTGAERVPGEGAARGARGGREARLPAYPWLTPAGGRRRKLVDRAGLEPATS